MMKYFLILALVLSISSSYAQDTLINNINLENLPIEYNVNIKESVDEVDKVFWDTNLAGILISSSIAMIVGLLTFFASKKQVQIEGDKLLIESNKLRNEIKSFHSEKILEKRLESFPLLFGVISKFQKEHLFKSTSFDLVSHRKELEVLLNEVNNWDNSYSILLSPYAAYACFQLRELIHQVIENNDKSLESSDLTKAIAKLEISLKTDIGIYAAEFGLNKKRFETYEEIGKYSIEFEEGLQKYRTQQ